MSGNYKSVDVNMFFDVPGQKPWERGFKESPRAFDLFTKFRDLGPERLLTETARQTGCSYPYIRNLSGKNHWVERARAWDNEQEKVKFKALQSRNKKIAEKHAQMAAGHLAVLFEPIKELARRISNGSINLTEMDNASLIRLAHKSGQLIKPLVDVERLSSEMPSQVVQQVGPNGGPIQVEQKTTVVDVVRRIHGMTDGADNEPEPSPTDP